MVAGLWLEELESRAVPLTIHRMQQEVLVIWLMGVMPGHLLVLPIPLRQLLEASHSLQAVLAGMLGPLDELRLVLAIHLC